MNPAKQLWALIKGQLSATPTVGLLALVLCIPLLWMSNPYPALDLLIDSPNLFIISVFGALLLAPEFLRCGPQMQRFGYGTEFLLTRAADKRVIARAKTAFLYSVILAAPVLMILVSLGHPELRIATFSREVRLQCLSHIAGSTLVTGVARQPNAVFIPNGKLLVAEWYLWSILAIAAAEQLLIYIIYPLRFRRLIFWFLVGLMFFGLLASVYIPSLAHILAEQSVGRRVFLSFAAKQPLYWILTLVAAIAAQLWCEWRFSRLEH